MQAARGASLTADGVDPGTRPVGLLAAAALTALALDVATKLWVVERLRDQTVHVVGDTVTLHQSRNPGAAFGIAGGATVLFSAIAIAVAVVIVRAAPRLRSRGWAVSLGLVLGGALGNLVDRVLREPAPFRGGVVDFIDIGVWPSFNVADSAIVVGGALAVLLTLRGIEPTGRPDGAGDT